MPDTQPPALATPLPLNTLQQRFADALFAPLDRACCAPLLSHCAGDPARAWAGLQAYRNSVLGNRVGALTATYPICGAIIGEAVMAAAAHRHGRATPSRGGDLNAYGQHFADFLATYPPTAPLPYLPDVARLEWLALGVEGAADAPPRDLRRLADTPPEAWETLHWELNPAHAWLHSPWPLARIWALHQPGYGGDFTVDFGQAPPRAFLLLRGETGITVSEHDPATAIFLQTLARTGNLGEALAATPPPDLGQTLDFLVRSGLLSRVRDTP